MEETEGMSVIDVNSGGSALSLRADPKAALLKVNLQAAQQASWRLDIPTRWT